MPLTLYHNDMSTCAQKVRIALAEKGLEWESQHLKLREGDQYSPAYRKLNPKHVVPTLVHDGAVICESQVILEYLDDAFPDPPLRPRAPAQRARMRLWTKQLDEDVHRSVGVLSFTLAFRYQFLAMSAAQREAYFARQDDPARRGFTEAAMKAGADLPAFRPAVARFVTLFREMESALADSQWLAGDSYSLADVSYTPYLTRLDHLHFAPLFDEHPRVRDWYRRLRARPSYADAMTRWENPAYLEVYQRETRADAPMIESTLRELGV